MKQIVWFFLFCLHISHFSGEALPTIFKEYDIRGIVDEEFLIDDVDDIGAAIVTYLLSKDPFIKKVAVGSDGRIHSPLIKEKLIRTMLSYGWDVIDIEVCTTPVVYFSGHVLPVEGACMITASHNPGNYNGIKICYKNQNVFGNEIKRIQEIYSNRAFAPRALNGGSLQKYDLIADYIQDLADRFPQLIGADIHGILDCGNGAAGTVLPRLIEKMQWKQIALLYPEVDGSYPHHIADPTVENNMKDLRDVLTSSTAQFGLGFDGDCDRMAPITKQGRLVKGDQLLTILSKPILEANPGGAVVFDISSSMFLHEIIKEWGGKAILARTGVASIKKAMEESRSLIGGEISCHTVFKDKYFGFDDGIYSMMRLFDLLHKTKSTLEELLEQLPSSISSPTYRIPCEKSICLQVIEELMEQFSSWEGAETICTDGLRLHLANSWAIVRPSNTEPLISMRFEGRREEDLVSLIRLFEPVLNRYSLWNNLKDKK